MEGKRRGDSFIETNPRRKNVEGQEKRHRGRIAVENRDAWTKAERETEGENGGAPLTTGGENSREERTPVLL